jgi:hypothetical protein
MSFELDFTLDPSDLVNQAESDDHKADQAHVDAFKANLGRIFRGVNTLIRKMTDNPAELEALSGAMVALVGHPDFPVMLTMLARELERHGRITGMNPAYSNHVSRDYDLANALQALADSVDYDVNVEDPTSGHPLDIAKEIIRRLGNKMNEATRAATRPAPALSLGDSPEVTTLKQRIEELNREKADLAERIKDLEQDKVAMSRQLAQATTGDSHSTKDWPESLRLAEAVRFSHGKAIAMLDTLLDDLGLPKRREKETMTQVIDRIGISAKSSAALRETILKNGGRNKHITDKDGRNADHVDVNLSQLMVALLEHYYRATPRA